MSLILYLLYSRQGSFKRFQYLTNICIRSTKVERMLDKYMLNGVSSTSFNIFENKGNVAWMLNESLDQLKFDSTGFQQAFNIFYAFNNVGRSVQTPPTFGSTKC